MATPIRPSSNKSNHAQPRGTMSPITLIKEIPVRLRMLEKQGGLKQFTLFMNGHLGGKTVTQQVYQLEGPNEIPIGKPCIGSNDLKVTNDALKEAWAVLRTTAGAEETAGKTRRTA